MNLTAQIPLMREIRTRSFRFLKDRRTVIASADIVFIAALTPCLMGLGPW